MTARLLVALVLVLTIVSTASITIISTGNKSEAEVSAAGAPAALDKTAIQEIIKSYLSENPDVIISAVMNARTRQAAQGQANAKETMSKRADELYRDAGTPTFGNEKADVTVVLFHDYNCGYCKRVLPTLNTLLEEDPNLKVVIKDFPILGPASTDNAKAAVAAYALDKGKYWEFHSQLLKKSPRSRAQILEAAASAGYDPEVLKVEMDKPKYQAQLQKNLDLGRELGITGTPATVINDEFVRGAVPIDDFRRVINKKRN